MTKFNDMITMSLFQQSRNTTIDLLRDYQRLLINRYEFWMRYERETEILWGKVLEHNLLEFPIDKSKVFAILK